MSLSGVVQSPAAAATGFDSDTVLTAASAALFKAQGYAFCIRYLSLGGKQNPGDLTTAEAENILGAGLALMAVQHVRSPGWMPSEALGQLDGGNAAKNALAVGFSGDVCIWLDLEGVSPAASAQNVINHCSAWYDAVAAEGFTPGLYVGVSAVLESEQLYEDLPFQHYWKSASTVPDVATRGYQMVQYLVPALVNGIAIDGDSVQADNEGGQVLWLAPTTI
jgi:Domain of unknown function (DUF1906)